MKRSLPFIKIRQFAKPALACAVLGLALGAAVASSHREAPAISKDPTADVTDLYAFVSPDKPDTVTLIANWIPFEVPSGGPNFNTFDDAVRYTINIDNKGDGKEWISYQFRFKTEIVNPDTFLYNTGPITSLTDTTLNIRQFYSLTRVTRQNNGRDFREEVLVDHAPVAPANIGPRSTPNYDTLAAAAITTIPGGGYVFAGPRDDPFFVDLGSVFDLLGLRPFNPAHLIPLPASAGIDNVAGYNVHTTALQIPISSLGSSNGVIGVYASALRRTGRGTPGRDSKEKQLSRLGMPLVNEVLIPLKYKDDWNNDEPEDDRQFDGYVLNPEPTRLMNLLYPPIIPTQTQNRVDLLAVFHTGVPGLNALPKITHSDLLRLNTGVPPTAVPSRLGVLAGDLAGFPNGRRLSDDVVDIELQALACAYGAVGPLVYQLTGNCNPDTFNKAPNNLLGDGVDANDKPFLLSFPYMASPNGGYEAPQIPNTPAP